MREHNPGPIVLPVPLYNMFQLKWITSFRKPIMSGYTQSSGSIIDYVILRIFVLLALSTCWSWSLNREECEAKRAFDSQSHQFDRGGIYNDSGDSRKILLLPFRNTMFIGSDMGFGNDNIISGLSDNICSVGNIITDDNHMGGIDWYYYFQDGEMEIDSHDLGSSAVVFTPDALALRTPKLWMPSTSLHIGNYDAMTILLSEYLPTVIPPYIHSCHYFVSPILLSTRHEPQYAHYCHRLRLMSNNGEWSNRVSDTHEDNDHFYDYAAGYYARPSAGVSDDVLAKISHQSPKRGDDLDARAMATIALMEEAANVPTVLAIRPFIAVGIIKPIRMMLQRVLHYGEIMRLILYHCHYCYSRYDNFDNRCMMADPTVDTLWDVGITWSIVAYGSLRNFATSAPAPMDAQTLLYDVGSVSNSLHDALRLIEWIDVTTWTQCLIAGSPISSALHNIQLTSTNIVDPWGAIVGVVRRPTCARLMITYHTSTWVGYYYYSSAATPFGPCFSADTLPLHMHSCRYSNHDGGDFPCTVSPNLDGRNEQQKKFEKKHTGYHCKSSSNYYAGTQVSMRTMHNSHQMHLVRSQDHGEPIGCIFRWNKNSELTDYIVKSRKHGERIVCAINPQYRLRLLHHGANFMLDASTSMCASIEPITDTSSNVDDYFNGYVERTDAKTCVIGDTNANVDDNITNGAGMSYSNGPVDWGAVSEPLTNIYGHYCAAWRAQGKPSFLMSDMSVTSYADIRTSPSPCTITRRLLRLLLIWIQPFETPLIEDNCRSIDSNAMYAWATSETGEVDLDVEVEEHDLTDDTNMPSRASLVNGEQLLLGMIEEPDTNSIRYNDATIDGPLLGIYKHLMQQPMKRRFDDLANVSMQLLMKSAQYCSSHEHHIIMIVLCMNLAPIIVPLSQYDASTNATKMELRMYAIRKDITPLDGQNNNSSSTSMGRYDIVDSGTRSSDTVTEEHLMSIEGEQPYEGITLSDLRTRLVFADDVFNSGLSVPTIDLHSIGTLPKIEKSCSYLGSLSSECMPQHLNELYRNDPTSPGHTHDATIVNFSSNTQPKNAAHTIHLMLSDNSALENNDSGTSGFNAMVKYWAYQAISTWLILQLAVFLNRGKLKLVSTAGNTTALNGYQTFGRLMGSHGIQYHIDRTNGTNRRGVTNECRPDVDTDSISTIDASTFREYWYSKSSQHLTMVLTRNLI